jgi:hypothetical protein
MKTTRRLLVAALGALISAGVAHAGVSADEAALLKTTLTPFGAERAGNKDGSIPAWTGAAVPNADIGADGRRRDPFAGDKPLFSINAKNMDPYADKLTEGTKALMKKFPETFRIDVYPTRRTGQAPQAVYDAVAKNAVNAKIVEASAGLIPQGSQGAIPFPIPKAGVEVVWNHLLNWRTPYARQAGRDYQVTSDGQWVMIGDVKVDSMFPYLQPSNPNGEYLLVRQQTFGPALRAGESITGRLAIDDDKSQTWVYLTGQRRVRKLPNPCCDTPAPFAAGIASFDEVNVFTGRTNRFDWKIVGKKEVFIPYNTNHMLTVAKDSDLFGEKFLKPDHVRWELHRVWVVDATLRAGQRHTSAKSRYYFDEDTWLAVTADRYDASGTLARVPMQFPIVASEVPAIITPMWAVFDLVGGSSFVAQFMGERKDPVRSMPPFKDAVFTPDLMAGEGVR